MITGRGRWLRSCGGTAGHTGGPCPGSQTLACLGGSQCPCFSSPSPNRECAARTGVATTFPPSVAEGNFRPQPRWPRGPAPWILTRWAPQSPGGLSRPGLGPAAVPAHLAGHPAGVKPPRVLRSPSQGPLSLLRRGSHPAGEEAPSLISSAAPEMAGERCPRGGRREVSTVGRRERDFPIRSPRPDGAATTATAPDG